MNQSSPCTSAYLLLNTRMFWGIAHRRSSHSWSILLPEASLKKSSASMLWTRSQFSAFWAPEGSNYPIRLSVNLFKHRAVSWTSVSQWAWEAKDPRDSFQPFNHRARLCCPLRKADYTVNCMSYESIKHSPLNLDPSSPLAPTHLDFSTTLNPSFQAFCLRVVFLPVCLNFWQVSQVPFPWPDLTLALLWLAVFICKQWMGTGQVRVPMMSTQEDHSS